MLLKSHRQKMNSMYDVCKSSIVQYSTSFAFYKLRGKNVYICMHCLINKPIEFHYHFGD